MSSQFKSNRAASGGGALFFSNVNATVQTCEVSFNSAAVGGAAEVAGVASLAFTEGTRIAKNRAEVSGSALFSTSGGGIYVSNGTIKFSSDSQASVSAVEVQNGGAIDFSGGLFANREAAGERE